MDLLVSNMIEPESKFNKIYDSIIVSRDDSLGKGRIQVKVPEITGDSIIWANPLLPFGGLRIIAIPPENQEVKVIFNGSINECYWLGGNIPENSIADVDTILIADDKENYITWQRNTGDIKINSSGSVSVVSKTSIELQAPTITLDGKVSMTNGATGVITPLNMAVVADGVVSQIK